MHALSLVCLAVRKVYVRVYAKAPRKEKGEKRDDQRDVDSRDRQSQSPTNTIDTHVHGKSNRIKRAQNMRRQERK